MVSETVAFDYKKEYKEFYLPAGRPVTVNIPSMKFIAVSGRGDPNEEDGEYKRSIDLLYGIAYTLKMSKMTDHRIDGYFDFVVPPLEGLWCFGEGGSFDEEDKSDLEFTSMIRVPDFINQCDFDWAVNEASRKKKKDFSDVRFIEYLEGLCVQCMHVGAFSRLSETIDSLESYARSEGYEPDISETESTMRST